MISKNYDDELQIGRGRKSSLGDNFALGRYWQKDYGIERFSQQYVSDCYSSDPQAVFTVISFGHGKAQLSRLLEYVNTRDNNAVEFYSSDGLVLEGVDETNEIVDEWSNNFRKNGSGRGQQRHFSHMVLSVTDVDLTEGNYNRVLAAAQATAHSEFGLPGYDYTLVLHKDTDNPHVHVVLNHYNSKTGKKLSLDKHDFLRIRSEFAQDLTRQGLRRHIATLRRDRPGVLHRVEKSIGKLHGQKERMDHLFDTCSYLNRKTQLNAQLTKQLPRERGFNGQSIEDVNIRFDSSGKDIKIIPNKNGSAFQTALLDACNDVFGKVESYKIKTNKQSSIAIEGLEAISVEQRKVINARYQNILREKMDKAILGTPKEYDFNNVELLFDTSKGYLKIQTNKIGRPFNATLEKICIEVLGSKKFGVFREGVATVNVKDVKELTPEMQKFIEKRFHKLIRKKKYLQQNTKLVNRSKNGLNQYKYLLKSTDSMIKQVKRSNLSYAQKQDKLKELKAMREKLLNNYDVKEIEKAALLSQSRDNIKALDELATIKTKLGAKDFYSKEKSATIGKTLKRLKARSTHTKKYKFEGAKINFGYNKSKEHLTIYLNRSKNEAFDTILKKVASEALGSNNYSLGSSGVAKINIKDKGVLSQDYIKIIENRFNTMIRREAMLQKSITKFEKKAIFEKKKSTAREFLRRKVGLEGYIKQQQKQLKDTIKIFRARGDSATVELLKGMKSAKTYQKIQDKQIQIKDNIVRQSR